MAKSTSMGPTTSADLAHADLSGHPVTFRCHCLAGAGSRVQDCPLLVS